jgi:hypothetical protein
VFKPKVGRRDLGRILCKSTKSIVNLTTHRTCKQRLSGPFFKQPGVTEKTLHPICLNFFSLEDIDVI